jgi:hypothetical protein
MKLRIVPAAKVCLVILIAMMAFDSQHSLVRAQSSQATAQDKPFVVEYYYKARGVTPMNSFVSSKRITTRC